MSCLALQVLYDAMRDQQGWAVERAFAPMPDFEELLRKKELPLYGLESFTPLNEFDVLGFTLQYEMCFTNVLTILDLGRVPLESSQRTLEEPLVIAGGPSTTNPEPMSRFIDLFIIGDGEESLPQVCNLWVQKREEVRASGGTRQEVLVALAKAFPFVYVPSLYATSEEGAKPTLEGVPATITPAVVEDLDAQPIPTQLLVPFVETVQSRIAIEIMRGCPGNCRFCQSTTIKRPLRFRSVENIVAAAEEAYRKTGYNEISLLSLSTGEHPEILEIVGRLREQFRSRNVGISVPSLRVGEQLAQVAELLGTDRHSGLTVAPEAAREKMRLRIGKPVTDEDLLAGCRRAFEIGYHRIKLYFMIGMPGETQDDLDGIFELAGKVAALGREIKGGRTVVVANVSNFVPKPGTPWQWEAMNTREQFHEKREYLFSLRRPRKVELKIHPIETSLLEGLLCRGDRSLGELILRAWQRGARFDSWMDMARPAAWHEAIEELEVDTAQFLHTPRESTAPLPWSHIAIRQGVDYLIREREKSNQL